MSIAEEAKKFHADKRGNCAMAVAYGYARGTGKTELEATDAAQTFRGFGGGKAPEGRSDRDRGSSRDADAIEDFFKHGAKNCTKCKEIRPNAVIPCNRCVELAGEALDFLK